MDLVKPECIRGACPYQAQKRDGVSIGTVCEQDGICWKDEEQVATTLNVDWRDGS